MYCFSLQFQIVSSTVRMHALGTLFSSISLQFQIISKTVTVHALETLFSFWLCSFKYCQNVWRYTGLYNYIMKLKNGRVSTLFDITWLTLQNIKLFPSKNALKCPKMQLRQYRISKWCQHTQLSLATPLTLLCL